MVSPANASIAAAKAIPSLAMPVSGKAFALEPLFEVDAELA